MKRAFKKQPRVNHRCVHIKFDRQGKSWLEESSEGVLQEAIEVVPRRAGGSAVVWRTKTDAEYIWVQEKVACQQAPGDGGVGVGASPARKRFCTNTRSRGDDLEICSG